MPINPSPNLMQRMLPTLVVKKGTGVVGPRKPIDPSWLSKGFEGISDTILGALGIGPDTTMNRVGAMGAAALPIFGRMPMGRFPEMNLKESDFPIQNRLAMGFKPGIADEAGRTIAPVETPDPVFAAHVASSRNKNVLPSKVNLTPSNDTLERMMARYKK